MKFIIYCLLFFACGSAFADCSGLQVYRNLENLLDVSQFYNCEIEVAKIDLSEEETGFLVYGKDLFYCRTLGVPCLESIFEFKIEKKCLNQKSNNSNVFRYSNGFDLENRKIRNHIEIKNSGSSFPAYLAFGQTDMFDGRRISYIQCQRNVFGGQND